MLSEAVRCQYTWSGDSHTVTMELLVRAKRLSNAEVGQLSLPLLGSPAGHWISPAIEVSSA